MKKNNILIIESTDCHTPYIETLTNLFHANEKFSPYAFFNDKHKEILKKDFNFFYQRNLKKFTTEKFISRHKILQKISQTIQIIKTIKRNNIKHITVNTIQTKKNIFLMLYLILQKKQYSLTIHDTQFDNKRLIDKIFSKIQKILIEKASFLFFLGDYLNEDKIFRGKNKIYMQYVYNQSKTPANKYRKKTLVIMNSPDPSKGDFNNLFKQLSKLKNVNIIMPMRLRTNEIKEILKLYNLENKIKYFEEYVPENEYREILRKSHIAIIPKLLDTASGKRKISAGFSYSEGYNLPVVVHESFLKYDYSNNSNRYKFSQKNQIKDIISKLKIKRKNTNTLSKEYGRINNLINKFN